MRRARTVDWLLLVTLLAAYAAVQGLALRNYLPHAGWWFPFSVTGAQGEAGHPIVDRVNAPGCPLRVGDRVLSAGGIDLRGLSRADAYRAQTPLLAGGRPYRVEAERGGDRFEVSVEPAVRCAGGEGFSVSFPSCSPRSSCCLRAPHWHLSRRFFAATIAIGSYPPADVGQLPWVIVAAVPVGLGARCSGVRSKQRRPRARSAPGSACCPGCSAPCMLGEHRSCTSSAPFRPGSGPTG